MANGSLYRPLLEVARDAGVDPVPVLERFGLTEASLLDRSARLSRKQGRALAQAFRRALGGVPLGLLSAEHFVPGDGDLLSYLLRCSACPLEGVQLLSRYARLWGDSARCGIEAPGGVVRVHLGLTGGYEMLHDTVDYAAGVLTRTLREATANVAVPLEVRLPRPRPRCAERYRRFFATQVVFGADEAMLVYREPALRARNLHADPRLLAILQERADELLARLAPATGSLGEQVRATIALQLSRGEPALPRVARRLGMSDRTLRRRLREAGLGYRELIEDVRRERFFTLAEDGVANVGALARQLGYTDTSAFARAVRRWTGMAPRELLARKA